MNKLSVVISAYNEERNIGKCLESIGSFADEVIVVDNSSSDRTAVIAKRYTDKIYSQKNDPEKIDIQKNFGISRATGDWILSLDADERLTSKLKEEINNVINGEDKNGGFLIPRKNVIFGKWIKHTGWYPDYQLRLFKKGRGKFVSEKVHEPVSIDGDVGKLTEPILHENYQTINQFIQRMVIYTDSEAKAMIIGGYTFNPRDCLRMPFREFLRRFFTHEGYRDGLHGLALSLLMAFYHFVIFLKLWEAEKFNETEDTLNLLGEESKKMGRELRYWIYQGRSKSTKNPIKKVIYKTRQKMSS